MTLGQIVLHVPGRHNLQNALAAVAVGLELGVPFDRIAAALDGFRGAERRFEDHGEVRGVRVIEDYGHHPTEIAAVIGAARAALGRRLVVVFQPHRYSRTQRLLDRFGPALAGADEIVLTDIYAAGEDAVPGVTVEALADADPPTRDGAAARREGRQRRAGGGRAPRAGGRRGDDARRGFDWRRVRRDPRGAWEAGASSARHRTGRSAVPARAGEAGAPPRALAAVDASLARVAGGRRAAGGRGRWWARGRRCAPRPCGSSTSRSAATEHLSNGEVLALLDGLRGRNILFVDLEAWRQKVLASPWVADATMRRALPRPCEVRIVERRPMAIARVGGELFLIDEQRRR